MLVDFLYFDLGNVLVHFSYDLGCQRLAEWSPHSAEAIRQLTFGGSLQLDFESGRIDAAGYAQGIREQISIKLPDSVILEMTSAIFWPNWEMLPLLAALQRSGQKLGILSNTCSAHWNFVTHRYRFLNDLFLWPILSYEVGAMKPDAEIYRVARQRADCPPERIFFVDDRPENVAAAREMGWQAVLFHSARSTAQSLRDLGVPLDY